MHLLSHIADYVLKWGAPWAYSAFLYEDFIGSLKKLFHGPKHISKQIFEHFLTKGKLKVFSNQYIMQANQNDNVHNLYSRLGGPATNYCGESGNCRTSEVLGTAKSIDLSNEYHAVLECKMALKFPKSCFVFHFYSRMKYGNTTYEIKNYCENLNRNNSIIQTLDGKIYINIM